MLRVALLSGTSLLHTYTFLLAEGQQLTAGRHLTLRSPDQVPSDRREQYVDSKTSLRPCGMPSINIRLREIQFLISMSKLEECVKFKNLNITFETVVNVT